MKCDEIVNEIGDYFMGRLHCHEAEHDYHRIVTPFMFPDNDLMEVFVTEVPGSEFQITDQGETFRHLANYGVSFEGDSKRTLELRRILTRFAVEQRNGKLMVLSDAKSIGQSFSRLLFAMLQVSDIVLTLTGYEQQTFTDTVGEFFRENELQFGRSRSVQGASGQWHRVDFVFNGRGPLRLVETLTAANRSWATRQVHSVFYKFSDISRRWPDFARVAVIDDEDPDLWQREWLSNLSLVAEISFWSKRTELIDLVRARD